MLSLGKIKRGDTFSFFANLTDAENAPLVTAVGNIHCQVRGVDDVKLCDMVVAVTETAGKYLFRVDDTRKFPAGSVQLDIRIVLGGVIKTTDTMELVVEKEVTKIAE